MFGFDFRQAQVNPAAIAETKEAQDKDGRLYDSRSGFASYYRYGPRRVSRLCNQVFSNTTGDAVHVSAPKIHDSVFKRIKNNAHAYAPIGIPHDYELVVTVPKLDSADAEFRIDPLPAAASGVSESMKRLATRKRVCRRSATPYGRGSIGGGFSIF